MKLFFHDLELQFCYEQFASIQYGRSKLCVCESWFPSIFCLYL